jgi:hypothetical protein
MFRVLSASSSALGTLPVTDFCLLSLLSALLGQQRKASLSWTSSSDTQSALTPASLPRIPDPTPPHAPAARAPAASRFFAAKAYVPTTPAGLEVADMIAKSRAAQAQIEDYTQEQVDDLITAMVYSVAPEETSKMIAQHTIDETRLGNYDGKFLKIFRKTRATLMDIVDDKSVGIIERDEERNLVK